jgi:hypothetical protein
MKITLLNTGILTNYGTFEFEQITLRQAIELVKENESQSAIGHTATAEVLSNLLEIEVETNRIEYVQKIGEVALIFKLKARIPEGKILNQSEIEEIGYEFGILRRLK